LPSFWKLCKHEQIFQSNLIVCSIIEKLLLLPMVSMAFLGKLNWSNGTNLKRSYIAIKYNFLTGLCIHDLFTWFARFQYSRLRPGNLMHGHKYIHIKCILKTILIEALGFNLPTISRYRILTDFCKNSS